jgi:hypothetical protein
MTIATTKTAVSGRYNATPGTGEIQFRDGSTTKAYNFWGAIEPAKIVLVDQDSDNKDWWIISMETAEETAG